MALPAIIAGGTALASSIGSWIQGKRQAKKTRQANREMSKYAYSKDLEQWNRQNALNRQLWDLQNQYNTPKAQMERFKEAGLNPNLIYTRGEPGTAGSVQTSEMSKYNAPKQEYQTRPLQIPEMIGLYQNVKMKQQQIDNQEIKNKILEDSATKSGIDVGRIFEFGKPGTYGPYYEKSQAQAKSARQASEMQKMELDAWKDIMKNSGESKGTIQMYMNIIKLLLMRK